jgi:hypothetical protein
MKSGASPPSIFGRFVKGPYPERGSERTGGGPLGIDGEDEGQERFAPAAGAPFKRIPEFRLERDARPVPGDAEATFNQHAGLARVGVTVT